MPNFFLKGYNSFLDEVSQQAQESIQPIDKEKIQEMEAEKVYNVNTKQELAGGSNANRILERQTTQASTGQNKF